MTFGFLSFWCCLGDVFYSKRSSFSFAWLFCEKKKGKKLGGLLLDACFGHGGRKEEVFQRFGIV